VNERSSGEREEIIRHLFDKVTHGNLLKAEMDALSRRGKHIARTHAWNDETMQIRHFEPSDAAQVIALWRECNLVRPVNDPEKDIQRKLKVNPELFLVAVCDHHVVATVEAVTKDTVAGSTTSPSLNPIDARG